MWIFSSPASRGRHGGRTAPSSHRRARLSRARPLSHPHGLRAACRAGAASALARPSRRRARSEGGLAFMGLVARGCGRRLRRLLRRGLECDRPRRPRHAHDGQLDPPECAQTDDRLQHEHRRGDLLPVLGTRRVAGGACHGGRRASGDLSEAGWRGACRPRCARSWSSSVSSWGPSISFEAECCHGRMNRCRFSRSKSWERSRKRR